VKVNKAIILAAGKSKRLGGLTYHMPKCLLPLGSKTASVILPLLRVFVRR